MLLKSCLPSTLGRTLKSILLMTLLRSVVVSALLRRFDVLKQCDSHTGDISEYFSKNCFRQLFSMNLLYVFYSSFFLRAHGYMYFMECALSQSVLLPLLINLKVLVATIDALGHFETG